MRALGRFTGVLLLPFLAAGIWLLLGQDRTPAANPDPNHTHADLAVWVAGRKLDFSGDQFQSGGAADAASHPAEGPRKYLHLHDGIGHVIHRHKPGLTLDQFLRSIDVVASLEGDASLPAAPRQLCVTWPDGRTCVPQGEGRLFVNGAEMPYDLAYDFQDGDQILLTYGATDAQVREQLAQMTDDACRYSRTCPWRGEPPAENCIADPTVPCVVVE